MQPYPIVLNDIFLQNSIVFAIIFIFLLAGFRPKTDKKWIIPITTSQELKWLAIISIVFIHIGYELAKNWEFLHPLSAFAGVGVDIFLILSGYWLTISASKKPLGILDFYKKRLFKVFLPFWIAIILLYLLDFLIIGHTYSIENIIQSFLIYFPTADIWGDFNSPFWYLSWLLFFYLLFPLVFRPNFPIFSAIFLYSIALNFVKINPLEMLTNWLHAVHLSAFPLGMILASQSGKIENFLNKKIFSKSYLPIFGFIFFATFFMIIWNQEWKNYEFFINFLNNLGDGSKIFEQIKSILLVFSAIFAFIFFPFQNKFLYIFGVFSYEIYLLHWPIIARYDAFFHHFDAGIATILTLIFLIFVAFCFQKIMKYIELFLEKIFLKKLHK